MLTEQIIERIQLDEIVNLLSAMVRIPNHKKIERRESEICLFMRNWFER